ncbi:class I SAM-dependent methyltransferase [Aestuariivivens marinum]|uniref:class I SAM-dependent methyltransferase n=1 Tax=Aestuariivivens marinum TaxID=2913555 RepID=UPI001F57BF46|nr:class I SAM-dependent methyltransferase [Aestuariivivens marinum]
MAERLMKIYKEIKKVLLRVPLFFYYIKGKNFLNDPYYIEGRRQDKIEMSKRPLRTDIINFILSQFSRETLYLEIGVRNPKENFNKIKAAIKYSVDPGIEFKENPVDFKLTSDNFFKELYQNKILSPDIKFDLIFIDGLHLAHQVDRDIANSMNFIKDDGFIVLHDCNPPTEWHARYEYDYKYTPSFSNWNGTTWKAFMKWRANSSVFSCCIDTDFGVGILSKKKNIGQYLNHNMEFYEYPELNKNRIEYLNLLSFSEFKTLF